MSQEHNSSTAKEDEMWYRSRLVVVVWMTVLSMILFAQPAATQTSTQEQTTSSKQQMKTQPAQTTVKQVKPVVPVSPVKSDLRIDTRAGDIAAAAATDVMVIDLQGDGLDLGGRVRFRIGGSEHESNWTRPGTDDAFLAVDSNVLREMGFELRDGAGQAIQNPTLMSDGLVLTNPDGREVEITDAWHLLGQFDANKDGKINSNDGPWGGLSLFVDANADGTIAAGELSSMSDSAVRDFSLKRSAARTDAHGNTLTEGTFERPNGTTGTLAGVKLRRY
jgi:hypothetical protein